MKQKRYTLYKWLLLVLFLVYYGSTSYNVHVHMEEGMAIVHSHPFKKAAHSHNSLAEIFFLQTLSSITAGDGAVHTLQIEKVNQSISFVFLHKESPSFSTTCLKGRSLRAPPIA